MQAATTAAEYEVLLVFLAWGAGEITEQEYTNILTDERLVVREDWMRIAGELDEHEHKFKRGPRSVTAKSEDEESIVDIANVWGFDDAYE